MKRLAVVALGLFILLNSNAGADEQRKARPLNVLLLMTDQHHADWLGCAGGVVKTPHLDALARQGVRFTKAFVPVPYCTPTRAAIVTGLYPSSLGIGRNIDAKDDPLALREPRQIYQHQLAKAGYHCYQLGKWHIGEPGDLKCFPNFAEIQDDLRKRMAERRRAAAGALFDAGPRPGETELIGDVYLRAEIAAAHAKWRQQKNTPKQDIGVIGRSRLKPQFHPESVLADECIALIRKHKDEPFAITYSVSPPHAPVVAPAPYYDMYDPQKIVLPATWTVRPESSKKLPSARMGEVFGEAGLREFIRCYSAQVTMMDDFMGRILDTLDELKLTDNTLVIFTSDHGTLLGQHGMMDKAVNSFYDDLMRVPLIARLPGIIPAGKTCEAYVSSVDLAPTILDYLQAEPLAKTHGRSLRDVVSGKAKGLTAVFGERGDLEKRAVARMIRTSQWKLNVMGPGPARELFNLEKDPAETNNVANDPANADIVRQLEQQLRDHMEAVADPARQILMQK